MRGYPTLARDLHLYYPLLELFSAQIQFDDVGSPPDGMLQKGIVMSTQLESWNDGAAKKSIIC